MAFLASNSHSARTLFSYGRLTEGETFHQDSPSMRKFLEFARMTLMEDIVAIEDIETTFEASTAAKKSTTPVTAIQLQQPRNARPGIT